VFDYYMTESPAETHFMAYVFKAFPVEDGKVDFKRLDVGGRQ